MDNLIFSLVLASQCHINRLHLLSLTNNPVMGLGK
uniref:Uncharacterized protein n=1 Tax=Arundo donax TaxID=35708 RepID=A0A0A9BIH4_ARUDO